MAERTKVSARADPQRTPTNANVPAIVQNDFDFMIATPLYATTAAHLLCPSSPLPPSQPSEKATARQDQAGKASTLKRSGKAMTPVTRRAIDQRQRPRTKLLSILSDTSTIYRPRCGSSSSAAA